MRAQSAAETCSQTSAHCVFARGLLCYPQGREKVLGNLRKELHIGNDAHAEIMECVLNGQDPPRVVAAAATRCEQ